MTNKHLSAVEAPDAAVIGVALIGAGMIAERHVTALSAVRSRARLYAIVSRHPERAGHLKQFYEGAPPEFTSDLSSVCDNQDVHMVIVATPPSVRIDLIEQLAEAGKHILLEKPVARNLDEAEQVVQICRNAGVKLGVVFQHRVRSSARVAKRLLVDGRLGNPGHVEIAVPIWRDQSYYDELGRGSYARDGGGVLITQAIHSIDLALHLLGAVSSVQAMTATTSLHKMEAEDFAVVGLRFKSGVVGSLVANTATFPHGRETITIHCQCGSMRLNSESVVVSWHDGRVEQHPSAKNTDHTSLDTPKHVWHQHIIEDFINAIQNGCEPEANGVEALRSHRLIEAIEYSSKQGVVVGSVELT